MEIHDAGCFYYDHDLKRWIFLVINRLYDNYMVERNPFYVKCKDEFNRYIAWIRFNKNTNYYGFIEEDDIDEIINWYKRNFQMKFEDEVEKRVMALEKV